MHKGEKTHAGVGSLTLDTLGNQDLELDITGVHVATTVLEFSEDNFVTTEVVPMQLPDGTFAASSVDTVRKIRAKLPPLSGKVRSRISAYTSGNPKHVLTLR